MRWSVPGAAGPIPADGLRRLTADDLAAIRSPYAPAWPTARLDARTLQLGKTFGELIWNLLFVALVSIYSDMWRPHQKRKWLPSNRDRVRPEVPALSARPGPLGSPLNEEVD
jgi:hypothetical protein